MDDIRLLDMRDAGECLGQSDRWMQRNYPNLIGSWGTVF